jgi:uncharacterized protein
LPPSKFDNGQGAIDNSSLTEIDQREKKMKRRLGTVAGMVVGLFLAAYLAVGYVVYDQLSDISGRCQRPLQMNTPAQFGETTPGGGSWANFNFTPYFMPNYQTVRFPSREVGIEVAGWYVEADPAAPAVILVHGLGSCKNSHTILTPAGMLYHAGFNVLLIDVRDAGESTFEDGRSAVGNDEYQEVLGAWDWLVEVQGISPERIGVFGESLGAATSLIAFSQEPNLAAVFVDSPFDNLPQIIDEELARNNFPIFLRHGGVLMARLTSGDNLLAHNPYEAIERANGRPVFVLHGTADTRIGVHHSYQLRERAQAIGANATFWFPEGVGHVDAARTHTDIYETALVEFFRTALE